MLPVEIILYFTIIYITEHCCICYILQTFIRLQTKFKLFSGNGAYATDVIMTKCYFILQHMPAVSFLYIHIPESKII